MLPQFVGAIQVPSFTIKTNKHVFFLGVFFCDIYIMCALSCTQGELVDRIECNVENASVYVYHGGKHLRKAMEFNRSGRRVRQ